MNLHKDIFTILNAPTYYPLQTKIGYCGPEQVRLIVEANYNLKSKNEGFYTSTLLQKLIGGMMPRQILKILKKHGFRPKIGFLKGKKHDKISFLKKKLQIGPIVLMITHAYNSKTRFNLLRALWLHHYISIWGYNEKDQVFYVYDSSISTNIRSDIPIGNTTFSYNEIIMYGKYPVLGLVRNLYISMG